MVQILQTIQVAVLLLRFGCKISAMPGTSSPSIEPDRLSGFRGARGAIHGVCVKTIFKFYLLTGRAGVESGIFLCLNISRDQLLHKLSRSHLCHWVFLGTCTLWKQSQSQAIPLFYKEVLNMKKNRSRPVEKAFDDVALSSSIMQCPLWVSIRISAISKNSDASYQLHWPGYSRGEWFAKILLSFSLAREVGQKAKTSSTLFAKETFPLAVYFPSSPTRNVERYPGCIDILPTLKMS